MIQRLIDSSNIIIPGLLFLFLLIIERILPLRRRKYSTINRLIINLVFTLLILVTAMITVTPVSKLIYDTTARASFGLLHLVRLPTLLEGITGFLIMDLTFYWWHRANHAMPFLWRFHNVHHCDPDMDVSTSFRFHPVEIFISTGFRVFQIGIIGLNPITYALYELVFTCATLFHHSNLCIPLGAERFLNTIFVTPRMHGIHHSDIKTETNSNYSVIFRFWDRLHRSLLLNVPQSDIVIGVPGYREPSGNKLVKVLTMPFQSQADYWDTKTLTRKISNDYNKNILL